MIRPFMLFAAMLSTALSGCAYAQESAKPKLIIAISVDQFSADLFAEYRPHFTGGLKRLAGGVVFPAGYQSHAATETCPGHATILTGVHPSRSGIVANSWIDQSIARADKTVYCAEDETLGASSRDYVPSVAHLKVPTLGAWMKTADPASRVVAVAGKDRAAIMMGGHKTDAIWFLSPKDPSVFETLKGMPSQAAAVRANARLATTLSKPHAPMLLSPLCATRSRAINIASGKTVGDGRFARPAGAKPLFRASPESDDASLSLASDLISDMKLGKGSATDLIAIGLSATDYVGHAYGTGGSEMCLQLTALDAMLGRFFTQLDKAGIDYAVVLTADHGGHDTPERNREHAMTEAARIDDSLSVTKVSDAIGKALGITGPVLVGEVGDIWLAKSLTPEQRAQVLPRAVEAFRAAPQIADVFTGAQIAATKVPSTPPETWTIAERFAASYDPTRSGDILMALKPRVTPIPASTAARSYIATHGSVWDYDRRVPILFWRKGLAPFEQPNSVETVDIAPTLAAWIGLPITKGAMDGRCLDIDASAATSCR